MGQARGPATLARPRCRSRRPHLQSLRSFYEPACRWISYPLVLALLLSAAACAPGSATVLTGVGCSDPSCNEVLPETRRVLGCVGEACNELPPPQAAKPQAAPDVTGGDLPQPAVEAEAGSPPAAETESDVEEPSDGKLKVYYEPGPAR